MRKSAAGVYGLAVMGRNLALNIESRGYGVSVFNRSREKTEALLRDEPDKALFAAYDAKDFVASLAAPRVVILMVKAGAPVDAAIEQLAPLLEPGDLIIDGGNSHFPDTVRRTGLMHERGLYFLGCGISGGEEGARHGPAIMPGGSRAAYAIAEPILTAIAARAEGEPCCAYMGDNGAGHFVKMVHNGIEYGDMQLISEAYGVMNALGMTALEQSEVFADWNRGELDSYLIEITADILRQTDEDTGRPMVEVIVDSAGQKGTGRWTAEAALALGIPCPTLTEAVYARYISALRAERSAAASILPALADTPAGERVELCESLRRALYLAKLCAYAQGFALICAASHEYNWGIDPASAARVFRGGCIIRARFLSHIADAFTRDAGLPNLLMDGYFTETAARCAPDLRRIAALCCSCGIPVPALTSALSYYDAYRAERLPASLIQAQRDYFGAHTFERVDREGIFHREWI